MIGIDLLCYGETNNVNLINTNESIGNNTDLGILDSSNNSNLNKSEKGANMPISLENETLFSADIDFMDDNNKQDNNFDTNTTLEKINDVSCDSFSVLDNSGSMERVVSVINTNKAGVINSFQNTDTVISHKYSMASINDDDDNLDFVEKSADDSLTDGYFTTVSESNNHGHSIACDESLCNEMHVDKPEQKNDKALNEESILNEFFGVGNSESCVSDSSASDTLFDVSAVNFNRTDTDNSTCENQTETSQEENEAIATSANSKDLSIPDRSTKINSFRSITIRRIIKRYFLRHLLYIDNRFFL